MTQTETYEERYKKLSQIDKALDVMYKGWRYIPSYYDEYCLCEQTLENIKSDLADEKKYLEDHREEMSRREIRRSEQRIGNDEYEKVIYDTKYDLFAQFIVDDIRSLRNDDFDSLHTDIYSPGYLEGAISQSDELRLSNAEIESSKKARQVLDDVKSGKSGAHSKGTIIYSVCMLQARYDGFNKAYDKSPSDRFQKKKTYYDGPER